MFVYHTRFLTRGEVWFDNPPGPEPVDWILYRQCPRPVPGALARPFYTRLIDLTPRPEQLLAGMEPATAAKIRQALERDRFEVTWWDPHDSDILQQFQTLWEEFTAANDIGRMDWDWIGKMVQGRAFDFVSAKTPDGRLVAAHGIFRDRQRAVQTLIVSPRQAVPDAAVRREVNRANCLLIYQTMLWLKNRGIRWLDMGGWYPGKTDMRLLGMNVFKRGFGGQVVREYECRQSRTLKGWAGLKIAAWLERRRRPAPETTSDPEPPSAPLPHESNLSSAL